MANTILLVEDFAPFRAFVRAALLNYDSSRIEEVATSTDAVLKAQQLQPALAILDIGLADKSGLDTALEIRRISPESKLLFVSNESSVEIIQQAFRYGASGYVIKIDAGNELIAAVRAVMGGNRYLSSSCKWSLS